LNAYAVLDQAGNATPVLISAQRNHVPFQAASRRERYWSILYRLQEYQARILPSIGMASVPSVALNTRCFNRSKAMNIFYIIGVVVVVIVVAGYLGQHL
jgi:hypothetical protein